MTSKIKPGSTRRSSSGWTPGIRARIFGIVCIGAAGMVAAGIATQRANGQLEALAREIDAQHAFLGKINNFSSAVDGAQLSFAHFLRGYDPVLLAAVERQLADAGGHARRMDVAATDDSRKAAVAKLKDALARIDAAVASVLPAHAREGSTALPALTAALDARSKQVANVLEQLSQAPRVESVPAIGALHQALRTEMKARAAPDRMIALEMDYALQDAKAGAETAGQAGKARLEAIAAFDSAFAAWLNEAGPAASNAAVARDVLGILTPIVREIEAASAAVADSLATQRGVTAASLSQRLWLAFGLVILLSLGLALLVGRSITRSIGDIRDSMARLSRGETDVEIPHRTAEHEIGSMARSVAVFRDAMRERGELATKQLEDAARRGERSERLAQVAGSFNDSIAVAQGHLAGVSGELTGFARKLTAVSGHLERQMQMALDASDGTAGQTDVVAAAAHELSRSIAEINGQIANASRAVHEAAEAGAAAEGRMGALQASAREIGAVVSLISDIANRTNLLALNATIESARAGTAGRGFAVVAEEIKALAAQTSRATEDIAALVDGIQQTAGEGASGVRALADRMHSVQASAATVAAAVSQQDASVAEIARIASELSGNARQASSAASEAFSVSAESVGMAQGIDALAAALAEARERFATETERFVAEVRAA